MSTDNSNTVIQAVVNHPTYPVIKGLNLMMASYSAMHVPLYSTKPGQNLTIEYYIACILLVLAFSLLLVAKYLPEDERNLALVLDQVGIFLVITSLFFSFSMSLPPIIWVVLLFWAIYLIFIMAIIWCFYQRVAHRTDSSPEASTIEIHSV